MFEPHSGQVVVVRLFKLYLHFLQWRCVEIFLPYMPLIRNMEAVKLRAIMMMVVMWLGCM